MLALYLFLRYRPKWTRGTLFVWYVERWSPLTELHSPRSRPGRKALPVEFLYIFAATALGIVLAFFGALPSVPGLFASVNLTEVVEVAIGSPIQEEIVFRALMHETLRGRQVRATPLLVVSSFLFSAAHLINLASSSNRSYLAFQLVSAALAGAFYIALVQETDSILPPLSLHIMNNFAGILVPREERNSFLGSTAGLLSGSFPRRREIARRFSPPIVIATTYIGFHTVALTSTLLRRRRKAKPS